MKVEIPNEFCSEFKCLVRLIESMNNSQSFKNPEELVSRVLTTKPDDVSITQKT